MSEKIKEYSNGEITIVWKPGTCIHAGKCVQGLPEVFKPKENPWIKIDQASTDALINQVKACPSGALSYYVNGEKDQVAETKETTVEVLANGPLLVHGTCSVKNADGTTETKNNTTAFCRCGASANKPYCDGGHRKIGFEG